MMPKYKISEQIFTYETNKTLIVFEKADNHEKVIQSAKEIISCEDLLNNFSKSDIALLKYIVNTENEEL